MPAILEILSYFNLLRVCQTRHQLLLIQLIFSNTFFSKVTSFCYQQLIKLSIYVQISNPDLGPTSVWLRLKNLSIMAS
ncbi:hypothetical protein BpHYR1_044772 [Brachionus plicatilis]|uniref:Uncharacterized protein n=1 Tax=Brachionus plicatilis TaxID=10195 RepID=A0A3M7R837_BRAPC|nr:hypothetical protein BpHYR1_044772 [Brachionus plicatilis]